MWFTITTCDNHMMFISTLSLHSYGQFKFTITQLMYTIMLLVCASDQLL